MRATVFGSYKLLAGLILLLGCVPAALPAQPVQPDAAAIMTQARTEAEAEHKKILAVFSASWCGPCHQFEAFLKDPKIKPIMDREFVTAKFDVGENPGDTRHADTPGGMKLRTSLVGADEVGFPYLAMLDPAGKPIVDSMRPDHGKTSNIGYPAIPVEIDWFMQMLKQAAPTLTGDEAKTIKRWLDDHAKG